LIELRSDTFSLPTAEMMSAILQAQLGDDGYREDPTVRRLEELAASKLGKEAACLMPSGTMANLASVLAHCDETGNTVLVGDESDIHVYEDATLARGMGIVYRTLHTQPDGTLSLSDIEQEFRNAIGKSPEIALVCLENPHNLCGGVVLTVDYIRRVAGLVHSEGASLHLDGARLFNAASRLKIDPAEIVRDVDSVQFCLSKGLAAPIGSMAVGSSIFIENVRVQRKRLGGNMRQAGIIAAAGIVALEKMVDRLEQDHVNARHLAEGLAGIPGIEVDLSTVQTNTVVFRVVDDRFDCDSFIRNASRHGINVSEFKRGRLRAVTHWGTTAEDIEEALKIFARIVQEGPAKNARAASPS
jgi:threonine aldolase